MTKHAYTSGRSHKGSGTLGHPEQATEDERPFAEIRRTLHDILRMLVLHRWAFFVPLCLVSSTAFVLSLYFPRMYTATTTFERRNDPVMMNLPMSSGAAAFKYFRNTMVQDLTSVETLAEVVENLGLIADLPRNDDGTLTDASVRKRNGIARSLAGALRITTSSPSEQIDVIQITYTGPDPTIGTRLVDEVKRTYTRRTMAWVHEFLNSQRDYFTKEAGDALETVKKVQRDETRLRLENPHVDPGNPGNLSLKLTQLEAERRELLMREREYKAEIAAAEQLLAATAPPATSEFGPKPPSQGVAVDHSFLTAEALEISAKIRDIDAKIKELRDARGMTDQHPDILDLLARRGSLESQLEGQSIQDRPLQTVNVPVDEQRAADHVSTGVPWAPYASEHAGLLAQVAAQQAKLKDVSISLETNDLAIQELTQAKREIYDKQEDFAEVTGRVAQARQAHVQLEMTLANIEPAIKAIEQGRLLQFSEGQPARGSSKPISPKSSTVVLLALLAGLASGVVFVILAEIFDHVFRCSGQVARSLGLPLLECIDEIITPVDRRRLFIRQMVVAPIVIVLFIGVTGVTASMAYLSIERPWAYERMKHVSQTAKQFLAGEPTPSDVH